MTSPDLPQDPFTPKLPRVSQAAIQAVGETWRQNPSYLRDTVSRLMAEQFDLAGSVAVQAQGGARDQQEMLHAMDTAALMYLCIEAQQRIDQGQ